MVRFTALSIHGDCAHMPGATCRQGGTCTYGYPKPFQRSTSWDDEAGHEKHAELTRWARENPDQLVTFPISKEACSGTGCDSCRCTCARR